MGTFLVFPLQVIDTHDYDLPEDRLDESVYSWSNTDWVMDIQDLNEREEMMEMMGIGSDFDITKSPFFNKIVIIESHRSIA